MTELNKKSEFSAQSPKNDLLAEIDNMILDGSRLLDSVYRDYLTIGSYGQRRGLSRVRSTNQRTSLTDLLALQQNTGGITLTTTQLTPSILNSASGAAPAGSLLTPTTRTTMPKSRSSNASATSQQDLPGSQLPRLPQSLEPQSTQVSPNHQILSLLETPREPRDPQTFDEEIERINRFCDNVDRNLHSIGIDVDDAGSNFSTNRSTNTNRVRGTGRIISNRNRFSVNRSFESPRRNYLVGNRHHRNHDAGVDWSASSPTDIINLSDCPLNLLNRSSDIIILDGSPPPAIHLDDTVVDLCTPSPRGVQRSQQNQSIVASNPLRDNPAVQVLDAILLDDEPSASGNSAAKVAMSSTLKRDKNGNEIQSSGDGSYKCPVCLESVRTRMPTTTKCGHVFCAECIQSALRLSRKCPLCNSKVSIRQLSRIYL